jgi:TPP-dependent pyruvate/acetoin dehydrogenase alpha subunit
MTADPLHLFRLMIRASLWEQQLLRFIEEGLTSGFYHAGRGQEAVAAGACAALNDEDYLLYDHRGLGHAIAKGIPLDRLFADFLGRVDGTTRGLGAGIVHIAWPPRGILGQSGTLGGSFPIAAGAALSAKMRGSGQVALCFFGEGASNRGTFQEAANVASLWNLPVVWLCENNAYAVSVPWEKSSAVPDVASRASAYGMPGVVVDGMDVVAVNEVVTEAVERARAGEGPTLIEAKTYRFRGHFEGDPQTYRSRDEVAKWRERDPITLHERGLREAGVPVATLDAIRQEVAAEVRAAADAALASPKPPASRVYEGVLA